MQYFFAPMEGVTGYVYRKLHRQYFGGADRYYLPFISANQSRVFSKKEWQDICPEHNRDMGVPLIPQILGKNADGFLWAARELRALGYGEINFNLGCPSGTVTAKGKGSGFLAHPQELDAFLDTIYSVLDMPISVKTRLGVQEEDEFAAILDIYNKYPIAELTIHPRVRKDFYKHPARLDAFAKYLPLSRNPVCYNGDLMSLADCDALHERFPQVEHLMLGRGLVADPALLVPEKRTPERLQEFHDALYRGYCEMFGNERNAMMRMKEVWFYHIHLFDGHEKLAKKLRRATNAGEFLALTAEVFRTLPLRHQARMEW